MTLDYEKKQISREKYSLTSFQVAIQNSIYYNKEEDDKGMYRASIISSYLIDYYIPFLPLDKLHIKKCIEAEFERHKYVNINPIALLSYIDLVAARQIYEPTGTEKFASGGCKKVPFLVRTFINQIKRHYIKQEL